MLSLRPEIIALLDDIESRIDPMMAALATLEVRPQIRIEPGLYNAGPERMLAILRTASQPTVMMLGHNPGIAEFAAMLPARAPMDPDFRRYPASATLVVDFQIDNWDQIKPGQGSALDFVRFDGRS